MIKSKGGSSAIVILLIVGVLMVTSVAVFFITKNEDRDDTYTYLFEEDLLDEEERFDKAKDQKIVRECSGNECGWLSTNCCPENAGAHWECVNIEKTTIKCSPDIYCPQVISPKPTEFCFCSDGECTVREKEVVDEDGEDEKDLKNPEGVVQSLYDFWIFYPGNPNSDRAYKNRSELTDSFKLQLDKMYESSPIGYDPILCAQDVPSYITTEVEEVRDDEAFVVVTKKFSDYSKHLISLNMIDEEWKINEIHCLFDSVDDLD